MRKTIVEALFHRNLLDPGCGQDTRVSPHYSLVEPLAVDQFIFSAVLRTHKEIKSKFLTARPRSIGDPSNRTR